MGVTYLLAKQDEVAQSTGVQKIEAIDSFTYG